jgi:hypothetical protein
MAFVELLCAEQVLRIDASICEMATERVHWKRFLAPNGAAPSLTVRRHDHLEGTTIDAPLGKCTFMLEGEVLDVKVEDGVWRGELVLRLAWYLLATRQGAVLIHACALRQGDSAVVAAGKSGDGKSTLSRLGVGAGLELLTDEVVMLFPDGRVCGTPFRSDFENAGQPGLVKAKYFFALEKAPKEELKELNALAATQLAMAQCFDVAEVALPRGEVRKRLLQFLSNTSLRTLAFRKDPAAGEFVKLLLSPHPDPLPVRGEGGS